MVAVFGEHMVQVRNSNVPYFGRKNCFLADLTFILSTASKPLRKFQIHIFEAFAFWYGAYFFFKYYKFHMIKINAFIDNETAERAIRNNRIKWLGLVAAGVAFNHFCRSRSIFFKMYRMDSHMNYDTDYAHQTCLHPNAFKI